MGKEAFDMRKEDWSKKKVNKNNFDHKNVNKTKQTIKMSTSTNYSQTGNPFTQTNSNQSNFLSTHCTDIV